MNKKVIVAGHICVDITPEVLGKKVSNLNEILAPGKLIPSGDITISTGRCQYRTFHEAVRG